MGTYCYNFADEDIKRIHTSAALVYVSSAHYGTDWTSVLHTHTCTELFYVIEGSGQFQIGASLYPVKKYDLILINSQVEHTETSSPTDPLEYIVLGVDNLELSRTDAADSPFCIIDYSSQAAQVIAYLRTMLREVEQKELGYQAVCQDILNILITQIIRNLNFTATLTPSPTHLTKEGALARRYIDEHFRENITLDLLADLAHVSKFHLSRSFTMAYGISPIAYMVSLRIEESKHLLRTTDFSLAYIARAAGFSSPSYFSQRFKQAEDISPAQYRQKFRVDNRG